MSDALDRALEELIPQHEEPRRWDEVLGRAFRRTDRRRLLAFAVAAGLAAVLIGAGGVFHRDVVDFFSAKPAHDRVLFEFGQSHGGREIATFVADGRPWPMSVTPLENGGFCFRWHHYASCGRTPDQGKAVKIGLGGLEGEYGTNWLVAAVVDPAIHRLELEYADGETVQLPFVWVSAPIDAGFTAFQVPEERQRKGLHAVAVTGYDADGNPVERRAAPVKTDPQWEAAADGLPRIADRSRKRTLFDFRDGTGERWTLVVAPAPDDKLCYAFDRGGACISARFPATPPSVFGTGKTALLCCTVTEGVAQLELVFEDGDRIEVKPVDGFILYAIPSAHYAKGKRLQLIISRDESGSEIGRVGVNAGARGLYPCKKGDEVEFGYRGKVCP